MKKKVWKTAAFVTALLLIAGLLVFANALVGNPFSKMLVERKAKAYLAENYGGTDFVIDRVSYSFKDGDYYAYVQSPSSADSYFSISFNMVGNLLYDSYENTVASGENTARRLHTAYRALTDSIFDSSAFPFESDIIFGDLEFGWGDGYTLSPEDLELDGLYDIRELGAKAGRIVAYIEDETVSTERAAEIMLELKRLLDGGGAPFYRIDFVLESPESEERIDIREFLYSDIYESGMEERVMAASAATAEYYAQQDKQNVERTDGY